MKLDLERFLASQQVRVSNSLKQLLQADSVFSGISTFGRLPYFPCLSSEDESYDIAFLGEYIATPIDPRHKFQKLILL
jgi:hypothetical protein